MKPTESTKDRQSTENFPRKIRFEIWGEEMVHKEVKHSAKSGRVYLPPRWVGCTVKIIRID